MLTPLIQSPRKIVGTRTLTRAIEAGEVERAYIAQDADVFITRRVAELCQAHGVPLQEVSSMKALGEACGVRVKTAAAGIRK